MSRRRLLPVLLPFLAIASGATPAFAQTAANQDVLAALLSEVRALRVAMEQMASAGPRIQIAFGRLQLQEQRVQTLIRRHTDVQERVQSAQRQADDITQQIEIVQESLQQITEPGHRAQVENELKVLTQQQKQAGLEVQRLRGEEIDLAQQVATEQNRWMEIDHTLEDLERSLKR
jgi:peptidoglycan hydrolase CwlO-like protein